MKIYVGNGQGSTKAALEEATRGLTAPSAILFLTPFEQIKETAVYLAEKYRGVPAIGTIGLKFAKGTIGDRNTIVVGFFEDAKVKCGVIEQLDTCPIASAAQLENAISAVQPEKENTVCIEFCTNDEEKLVTTMNAVLSRKKVPLIGATAYEAGDGKTSVVAYDGQVYENACAYLLIKNTTGKIKVFKENIYKKQNSVSHFATKVDRKRKALIQIDGRPAADVYSQELGVPKNKIIDNVFKNPIGRVVGDQVFISSMKEVGTNGEFINYKRINQNDCIYFLGLGDYKKIEEKTREKIRSEFRRISFVFSVDCNYRHLLYEGEHFQQEYVRQMASLGTHVGIVGGGEQFINQHVNQTMVCAVFE